MIKFRMLLATIIVVGAGWASSAQAQQCPNGTPRSEAGICPTWLNGDPTCADAEAICGFVNEQQIQLSPPQNYSIGSYSGLVSSAGGNTLEVKDTSFGDQNLDVPGFEAAIVRGQNGAHIFCGPNIIHDIFEPPGPKKVHQLTLCFGRGPCSLNTAKRENACDQYDLDDPFFLTLKSFAHEETENDICGCNGAVARECKEIKETFDENGDPRVVVCIPEGEPLQRIDNDAIAVIGEDSCITIRSGGKRYRIDEYTGELC